MGKLIDDAVIITTVVLCLMIALLLSYSLVERGANYPPTLITLFLGIAVAALTYRFLGGVTGTEFSVGLLKLGGSAALLLGTTFFVGERIRDEMNILENSKAYRQRIESLVKERDERVSEQGAADLKIQQLQKKIADAPAAHIQTTLADLEKMSPTDSLIKGIRRLVEAQQGAFRATIRDMTVGVAVVPMQPDLYNICQEKFDALYSGTDPNTKVRFARSVPPDGNETSVVLDRRGRIGQDVCGDRNRNFDVQVGCVAAQTLFPDVMKSCADGAKIRGLKISIGALP